MGIMNELMGNIRHDVKKYGYQGEEFMFHTDFINFDMANAQVGFKDAVERIESGIDAGKSIMITGKPGCGKTTFGLQLIWSVMKKYEESTLFYLDYECAAKKERILGLTGMTEEYYDSHVELKQVDIYTETLIRLYKQIAVFKKEHREELLVDNKEGYLDENGKPIKILPPTFIFVDSITGMKTFDYQEGDELNGLTAGGRTAINNKEVFTRMVQPCLAANIIVVAINQETQNMSMGVTPPVAQTRFLKNTTAVGGGSGIQFFTNLWYQIEASDKYDLTPQNNRFGDVIGYKCIGRIIKSRNAEGGRSTPFVFDQRNGYDVDLSNFLVLEDNKVLIGKGTYTLPGLDSVKFTPKTLKTKLATIPEFRKRFDEVVQETLYNNVTISRKLMESRKAMEEESKALEEGQPVATDTTTVVTNTPSTEGSALTTSLTEEIAINDIVTEDTQMSDDSAFDMLDLSDKNN